jgi:hypothetical protein
MFSFYEVLPPVSDALCHGTNQTVWHCVATCVAHFLNFVPTSYSFAQFITYDPLLMHNVVFVQYWLPIHSGAKKCFFAHALSYRQHPSGSLTQSNLSLACY